jgi:hypothetical protein
MKKSISNLIKLLSLAMILAFIVPVVAKAQGGKVNFAGTWTMNESKSTMPEGGGGRMMGGSTFTITQEANLLTRTSTGQDGTQRVAKYTLDGKESVNTSGRGDSKSIATWSADGKTLNIATTRTTNNGERKSTEAWTLTDAKTLTIASTFTTQDGERKAIMVYDKK